MKNEKGITLISLVIYLIAMVIIVALIASLSGFFYKNIDIKNQTQDMNLQFSRFNSYFTEDINKSGNKVYKIGYLTDKGNDKTEDGQDVTEENFRQHYVLFTSGNQYTFVKHNTAEDGSTTYGAIYFNKIKIATNITDCSFVPIMDGENNIKSIKVNIKGKDFEREITYSLAW